MPHRIPRLSRSYLFAPGSNEKLLSKVFTVGADAVLFDLEDAVAPSEKARARAMVAKAVADSAGNEIPVFVRINGIDSDWWRTDIRAIVGPGLSAIRVPKCEFASDLIRVNEVLSEAERAAGLPVGAIGVACAIESAKGVLNAQEIARAPRVLHLSFGASDYTRDLAIEHSDDERETLYAKSHIATVSRAMGLDAPVAAVYTKLSDLEGLRRSTEAYRRLGFFGRACIHPSQVPIVNDVFTPTEAQIEQAAKTIELYETALASGSAAVQDERGQFIDEAIARRARDILARAKR
jgi:citrate lyase subunit beta/citryl-CoA lyase